MTLKGAKECVEGARARIQEIVTDLEEMVELEVVISQRYHRTVMGARGSKVQAITTQHEVQIKFPEKDSGMHLTNGEEEGVQVCVCRVLVIDLYFMLGIGQSSLIFYYYT